MDYKKNVSANIKRLRRERKLTMQQLADEAGCSKSQINSVEGRARNLGFIMGCRIAKALGVKNPFRLLEPEK